MKTIAIAVLLGMAVGCGGSSGGDDGPTTYDPTGPDPDDDGTLPTYPKEHPRIYVGPNRDRLTDALEANTPPAMRFKGRVDLWLSGADLYGFQAWNGALMTVLTGNKAYCTKSIGLVEAQVVDAEASIAAGRAAAVAGDSYLEIGEMIGNLALVYDYCFDQVSSSQRSRWIAYANTAVGNVWNPDAAKWGSATIPWSGWSIDNPSNNYYYSFLRATMLLGLATKGENPMADEWIKQFRDAKIYGQLVPTFSADLVGGGSREGTGYGVAMRNLYELYDFWTATTGEKLHTKTRHARSSMTALVHQIVPTLDRFAPTGDQSRDSTASLFDYHRSYLQDLISLYPKDPIAGKAKQLLASSSVPEMSQGFMFIYDFLYDLGGVTSEELDGIPTAYYAPGIGELYARSGWDSHATWINLIAGPYTESHAHQDQGSLMIYKDGWLAYDPVVDTHSGIDQEVTTHGIVRIDSNGRPIEQRDSTISSVVGLHRGTGWVYAGADLTPAYDHNAAVQMVHREIVYLEPNTIVVYDRVQGGTSQTWQLAVAAQPVVSGNMATLTAAGHQLQVTQLGAGTMSVYDYRTNSDFSGGFRLDQTQPGGNQRYLNVITIDGAATTIAAQGDSGASMHLADGRNVTVAFDHDTMGATLTINGTVTTLGAGVDDLSK